MEDPREVYSRVDRVMRAAEGRIRELTGISDLPRYEPPTRRLGFLWPPCPFARRSHTTIGISNLR